jgi:hypothetical protein
MTALEFHSLSDLFPLLEGVEFDELVADIKVNRLRDKIVLYDGMILDGRNRYRALRTLGVDPEVIRDQYCVEPHCIDASHGGPKEYVISANIRRRHLTAEQKIDVLSKLVAVQPKKSDRQLAKETGVTHPTIAKARREAEATGKALPVEKRVGADGKARKQPARKPEAKQQPAPKHDARIISPELGERVGRLAYRLIQLDRELARELADLILQRGVAERLWADLETDLDIEERGS